MSGDNTGEEIIMKTNDQEVIDFVQLLQHWHEKQIEQLETIISHEDADLVLGEKTIPAGSELAKGIRIGVNISLNMIGKLPFSLKKNESVDVEE
jgi:hypothetical protein